MADDLKLDKLTPETLLALARRTDPVGVLSLYVDARGGADPNLRAERIDIGNRLAELRRRLDAEGPPERARAVSEGIKRVQGEIDRLTAPGESGRGRALFAALGGESVDRFASRLPLRNRVVLDGGAFIHPLVEVLDAGRPAGVVLASQGQARLLEWRLGDLVELERIAPEVIEAPHERSGPVGPAPGPRQATPQREQRAARERDQTARLLDEVAAASARAAADRGWERVLISGGERLTEPLASAFPAQLRDRLLRDSRLLAPMGLSELNVIVTEQLRAADAERETRLVESARQSGALGLSEVATALNEGRVAHLLYDPEIRYEGLVGEDGAIYAPDESGPAGVSVATESRLTERLVEAALETSARVSPLEGAVGDALADAGGIAALLRW